jgi:DNA-binding MarR family transcriptional regulator
MTRAKAVDPLRALPGYALKRAASIAMDQLRQRLKAIALRPVDASVLLVVQANAGITQSRISRMLDIAAPNMATLTSRLLERGLVSRNDLDGRSHGLVLTAAGEALAAKSFRAMKEQEATLMGQVPPSLRRAFLASLQALLPPEEAERTAKKRI